MPDSVPAAGLPSLSASPFPRYAGAAINVLGVVGFVATVLGYSWWRLA